MPSSADIHHLRNRIWLVAGMFIVLIFLFVWYVSAEKEINNANMNSFISLSLAILIAFVALGAFMLWTIRSIYLARVDAARKTAEDTLASTSQRLSNIINATQVGTWERNIQTGAMLINDRWANMLGYTIT